MELATTIFRVCCHQTPYKSLSMPDKPGTAMPSHSCCSIQSFVPFNTAASAASKLAYWHMHRHSSSGKHPSTTPGCERGLCCTHVKERGNGCHGGVLKQVCLRCKH
jgi:hypothetical protein